MPQYDTIDVQQVTIGQKITVRHETGQYRGCGQGGVAVSLDSETLVLESPIQNRHSYPVAEFDSGDLVVEIEVPIPLTDCIEYDPDVCRGVVDFFSPTGYGTAPKRCEYHVDKRIERRENSMEKYADSSVPPSWFDPSYAGESWDEDY